jgi:hypothetical protein
MFWSNCADTCAASTENGFTDWRMPTIEEIIHYRTAMDLTGPWSSSYIWSCSLSGTFIWGTMIESTGWPKPEGPTKPSIKCRCVR